MHLSLLTSALLATAATPALAAAGFDQAPRINPASAAEVKASCDAFLAEAARQRAAFEKGKGGDPAEQLRAYDEIVRTLNNVGGDAGLVAEVAADAARRDAARDCQARAGDAADALRVSVPVYQRLKAIPAARLDPLGRRVLERELGKFNRNGVSLDSVTREKVAALRSRINALGIRFEKGIADGTNKVTARPEELAGLPADYLAAHKPGPDGLVTITTDYPDLQPVMNYAASEDLRKRLYFANLTRAWPANDAVLKELLAARDQLAKLLGRPDFASLALEDKMIGSPAKARAFLAELDRAAIPAATRDFDRMQARYAQLVSGGKLNPWSVGYVQTLIRKESYALDPQELRRYFHYDKVRDGMLQLTRDLFGVEIGRWNTPVWDPSVEAYEMRRGGRLVGRFYFDTHPRPGKYTHANVVPIRSGTNGDVPVAALVTNFPAGLMEHRDVETFLHEYGHLIHGMFSGHQAWENASWGELEWDFIEAPSQMLENWVWDYDTLARFASDESGKAIPRELVEKMNKARWFAQGYGDRRQLGLSAISLAYHSGSPQADLTAQAREADRPYAFIPYPEGTHMQASFGHLSGYSAFYYTYMWSRVISADLFSRFEKEGLRNPATAAAYRDTVLAPGGAKPAAELVRGFLGREMSLEAYKQRLAKGE